MFLNIFAINEDLIRTSRFYEEKYFYTYVNTNISIVDWILINNKLINISCMYINVCT